MGSLWGGQWPLVYLRAQYLAHSSFYCTSMTYLKTFSPRSGYLLMILLYTWQSPTCKIVRYFSPTWSLFSIGREPGIWSLTQANARLSILPAQKARLSPDTSCITTVQELESVDAAKYLGVTISKDLSWNTHINNITSTAKKTLGFVKRNVVTKNKDLKTMAYNSLVRAQVEYAYVWSPYTKDNINKIEKVQRRAARWVTNDYSSYSSVTDMLSNLGWRSLENRNTDTRLAMFYKIVYGLVAMPLLSYLEHPEVYTRHMHSLTDRFTHQSVIINTHFSPYPLFFGTSYQLISSWFLILTP